MFKGNKGLKNKDFFCLFIKFSLITPKLIKLNETTEKGNYCCAFSP